MPRQAKNADRCGGFLVSILMGLGMLGIGFTAISTIAEPRELSPAEVIPLYYHQCKVATPWPGCGMEETED